MDFFSSVGVCADSGEGVREEVDGVFRQGVLRCMDTSSLLRRGYSRIGEELFFRGLIQGKWGVLAGAIAFGLGHIGKKEIRVISYWSFAHGFWLGLFYYYSGDLSVPMIAHGLFDLGGILYFRLIMEGKLTVV